jgi:hypothetical protein
VIAHHADSSASNKPVAQRRIPDGEKDDIDSPARFSWVTELVLTSRRRGQLGLSAVNFSAIQSHRAFHIDLWLATGPSTGYCPICPLHRQVDHFRMAQTNRIREEAGAEMAT